MMECGCRIIFGEPQWESKIQYCPMHKAAPELLEACWDALIVIEAFADGIDDKCGNDGCMCTIPGNVAHSQTYRDNEMATLRAAITKAEGK